MLKQKKTPFYHRKNCVYLLVPL